MNSFKFGYTKPLHENSAEKVTTGAIVASDRVCSGGFNEPPNLGSCDTSKQCYKVISQILNSNFFPCWNNRIKNDEQKWG